MTDDTRTKSEILQDEMLMAWEEKNRRKPPPDAFKATHQRENQVEITEKIRESVFRPDMQRNERIVELYHQRLAHRTIARMLGVNLGVVTGVIERYGKKGNKVRKLP